MHHVTFQCLGVKETAHGFILKRDSVWIIVAAAVRNNKSWREEYRISQLDQIFSMFSRNNIVLQVTQTSDITKWASYTLVQKYIKKWYLSSWQFIVNCLLPENFIMPSGSALSPLSLGPLVSYQIVLYKKFKKKPSLIAGLKQWKSSDRSLHCGQLFYIYQKEDRPRSPFFTIYFVLVQWVQMSYY